MIEKIDIHSQTQRAAFSSSQSPLSRIEMQPLVARFSASKRNFFDKPKNRRAWLFVALLLPILLLLIFTSAPQHYQSFRRLQQRFRAPLDGLCKHGTVYVYDLPPIYNKKLLDIDCQDSDPGNSVCRALSNDGFGPKATDLDGVIPKELVPSWHWTDTLAGDVIYHSRISSYKCRTFDPDSATAFYVPFYAGLAKYLDGNSSESERDYSKFESLLKWLTNQPSWKRSKGADHFIMLGKKSLDLSRDIKEKWGLRLTVERSPWDRSEISVPYPTGFHPRSNQEIEKWLKFVRTRNRSNLFTYVGGKSKEMENDFRASLLDQCKGSDSCKFVDCSDTNNPGSQGTPAVLEAFLDSNFCLQPKDDDGFTGRSTFDCMLAGSIPVFFWKRSIYGQYEWSLKDDPERFSVFIEEEQVRNATSIRKVLEGYGVEEIQMMRERVTNLIPRFLYYAMPGDDDGKENIRDAFEASIAGVLRRLKEQMVSRQ